MKITKYQDINEILCLFTQTVENIFRESLIGIYLTGSLSYGDFNFDRSDIDLVIVIKIPASPKELAAIKQLHAQIAQNYVIWSKRIECSYVPLNMLTNILPPKEPRPYYNENIFYQEAPYGNEWIINQYLLFKHSTPLVGPNFNTLIKPIEMIEVQKACIRDLFQEWEPKISDSTYLNNSHYQSYLILNLCRILYTVMCGSTGSKKVATAWVINQFDSQWKPLIQAADNWSYGTEMNLSEETIQFIKFAINEIKNTQLYKSVQKTK